MTTEQIQAVVAAAIQHPELASHIVAVQDAEYHYEEVIEMVLDLHSVKPKGFEEAYCIVWQTGGSEAIVLHSDGTVLS